MVFVAQHWKKLGRGVADMLSSLWARFFHVCRHEWETINTIKVYNGYRGPDSLPVATKYILRCKKCGEITARKV